MVSPSILYKNNYNSIIPYIIDVINILKSYSMFAKKTLTTIDYNVILNKVYILTGYCVQIAGIRAFVVVW